VGLRRGSLHRRGSGCRAQAELPADTLLTRFAQSASGAKNGLMHRSKWHPYSITWSARTSTEAGTSWPSALAVLRLIVSSYFVGFGAGPDANVHQGRPARSDLLSPSHSAASWAARIGSAGARTPARWCHSFALAVYASFGPLARSGFTVKRPTSHFSAMGSDVDSKGEAAENAMLSTAHGGGRARDRTAITLSAL
jgi:hypothetical protein